MFTYSRSIIRFFSPYSQSYFGARVWKVLQFKCIINTRCFRSAVKLTYWRQTLDLYKLLSANVTYSWTLD